MRTNGEQRGEEQDGVHKHQRERNRTWERPLYCSGLVMVEAEQEEGQEREGKKRTKEREGSRSKIISRMK